jgi:hypothetical protein
VSQRLARLVYSSDLPARLKPVAGDLAVYADDAGGRIYPSVERVAWDLGITPRSAKRLIGELRRVGVIVPLSDRRGGAGRTVSYRFDASALPTRAPLTKRCHPRHPSEARKSDTRDTVTPGERCHGTPKRVTAATEKGDASVTRSVREVPDEVPDVHATYETAEELLADFEDHWQRAYEREYVTLASDRTLARQLAGHLTRHDLLARLVRFFDDDVEGNAFAIGLTRPFSAFARDINRLGAAPDAGHPARDDRTIGGRA